MRTYLILKEKVQQFNAHSEIQGLLSEIREVDESVAELCRGYSPAKAKELLSTKFDRQILASRRLPYERLDQLTVEVLFGVK
jgi:xylose isomerase